jgi:DNA-binding response OmpR family regulator
MLLDLARRIVEQHCSRTASIQELIPSSVIEEVLGSVQESSHHTQETSAAIDAQLDTRDQDVPLATDEATTLQSLFFDAQVGEVRLGDKRTPLNGQLLTVMGYLWEHRTRLVRYEELETAVYGNNLSEREDPRGSLRRLVGRLRSKFQDGQTASRDYIDVRDGVGYQLKNWQDYQ